MLKLKKVFDTLEALHMPARKLAKCRSEMYGYQCEVLTMICQFEEAKTALRASAEADPSAGTIAERMQEWRTKRKKLRLLSERMKDALLVDGSTMEEMSKLLPPAVNKIGLGELVRVGQKVRPSTEKDIACWMQRGLFRSASRLRNFGRRKC
jgi:hypothetical protein